MRTSTRTDFEALLDGITTQYKSRTIRRLTPGPGSHRVLPANYSTKVLVLADPDTGCNFTGTTLQYADGSPATRARLPEVQSLRPPLEKTGLDFG